MKTLSLKTYLLAALATICTCSVAFAQYNYQPAFQGQAMYQFDSYRPQFDSKQQYGAHYQTPAYNQPTYAQTYNTYQSQQSYQPQQAYQNQQQLSQAYQTKRPTYVQPIHQGSQTQYRNGVRYDSNAGIGFDQRTNSQVGGNYYGSDDRFAGVKGTAGSGLYADAGVSQSGYVGDVRINNYARGSGFLGTEVGGQAGISDRGLGVGANAFAGGRATGTVGTEIGAFGVGGTGEAWSGAGLEAGLNAGYNDGKLRFGGELGAALGVGGKLGFEAEIDVRQIGQDIEGAAQDVGRWGDQAVRDVDRWGQQAGRDIDKWTQQAGRDIDRTVKNVGRDVERAAQDVGRGVENAAKDVWVFLSGKK